MAQLFQNRCHTPRCSLSTPWHRNADVQLRESYPKFSKLQKAVGEFLVYLERNKNLLRNYAKDRHEGRPISTAFIESLVNSLLNKRFRKKQQMQWSPEGAHLLLQVRAKVLNRELATVFDRWYPSLGLGTEQAANAEPLMEAA